MGTTSKSDKAIGFGALFGILGIVSALIMYVGAISHDQLLAGWGFALAMAAGALVVSVLHVYG